MKRILVLFAVVSITLVMGCGKEPEEKIAEKSNEGQTAMTEKVDVSGEPAGVTTEDHESKPEPAEKTSESKPTRDLKQVVVKPVDVGDDNFEGEVLKSAIPVLVDFWAPWCKPCLIAAPVLEKMADQYKGRLKVCKLNVDQGRQTARTYGIRSIPTLIIYKDGKPVDQVVGVTPNYESDLKKKIESHL